MALVFLGLATLSADAQPKRRVLPILPGTVRWTVAVSATTTTAPVITGKQVFAVLPPGMVAAFGVEDGQEMWRVEDLQPEQPLAYSDGQLFVAAGEAIHALAAETGAIAWRQPTGTLTAPLLVQDGWVIASAAGRVAARRASDGTIVWQREIGPQQKRAAIEGGTLYVPLTDGRVVALDLVTGAPKWQRKLGGAASEMLPLARRVYVGSADKYFYCFDAQTGRLEWRQRVGAAMVGRAAVDAERVYIAAMDNVLRAYDRESGAIRWNVAVRFRPSGGPVLLGTVVVVPGAAPELMTFDVRTGESVAPIAFGERLASPPGFWRTEEGPIVAAVTGGLNADWKLSLLEPSMTIPLAPLTVLPGLPVKIPPLPLVLADPAPRAPHARRPQAAEPLP